MPLTLVGYWQHPSESVTIALVVGVCMFASSCSADIIAISSMGYTDCAPIELPSFICKLISGECCLSAVMMLTPAEILSV